MPGRLFSLGLLLLGAALAGAETFTNPIGSGNDPWVKSWNGAYYYCSSNGRSVNVHKAAKLQDIVRKTASTFAKVWIAPDTGMWSRNVWAPELHYLDGKWYVYFAADSGVNADHRSYVLEGTSQDPQAPFVFKGKNKRHYGSLGHRRLRAHYGREELPRLVGLGRYGKRAAKHLYRPHVQSLDDFR